MRGSITPKGRKKTARINTKRKISIAKGSGTAGPEVNRLVKMHQEMETAMKNSRKMGGLKGLAKMFTGGGRDGMLGGGGAPPQGLPGLGGNMPNLPPGFQNFLKK